MVRLIFQIMAHFWADFPIERLFESNGMTKTNEIPDLILRTRYFCLPDHQVIPPSCFDRTSVAYLTVQGNCILVYATSRKQKNSRP